MLPYIRNWGKKSCIEKTIKGWVNTFAFSEAQETNSKQSKDHVADLFKRSCEGTPFSKVSKMPQWFCPFRSQLIEWFYHNNLIPSENSCQFEPKNFFPTNLKKKKKFTNPQNNSPAKISYHKVLTKVVRSRWRDTDEDLFFDVFIARDEAQVHMQSPWTKKCFTNIGFIM